MRRANAPSQRAAAAAAALSQRISTQGSSQGGSPFASPRPVSARPPLPPAPELPAPELPPKPEPNQSQRKRKASEELLGEESNDGLFGAAAPQQPKRRRLVGLSPSRRDPQAPRPLPGTEGAPAPDLSELPAPSVSPSPQIPLPAAPPKQSAILPPAPRVAEAAELADRPDGEGESQQPRKSILLPALQSPARVLPPRKISGLPNVMTAERGPVAPRLSLAPPTAKRESPKRESPRAQPAADNARAPAPPADRAASPDLVESDAHHPAALLPETREARSSSHSNSPTLAVLAARLAARAAAGAAEPPPGLTPQKRLTPDASPFVPPNLPQLSASMPQSKSPALFLESAPQNSNKTPRPLSGGGSRYGATGIASDMFRFSPSMFPKLPSPAEVPAGNSGRSTEIVPSRLRAVCMDDIPKPVHAVYISQGLRQLYAWQEECLATTGALQGKNLIYSAPTSGGKTLVAEILMLRTTLLRRKKAIFILPYVSLVAEKVASLQALYEPAKMFVKGFYANHNQGPVLLPPEMAVAVCTIEKANTLVNRLLEEQRLREIEIVVCDELHMISDGDRGYLFELLLAKIRYCAPHIQIVGMSATLPNLAQVAAWLKAELFVSDFRPVPLTSHLCVGGKVLDMAGKLERHIDVSGPEGDPVGTLVRECVSEGHSVIVFCPTKKGCEVGAQRLAKAPFMKNLGKDEQLAKD
eukprot:TRINITY_DN2368_c0_g1_i25.p1 TRINITY_DN2368_c0_g1~~TRINITY_DN2368_c0_g1_i25.p1  ORF type:complete len:709 (+),score=177.23 TRINITY_DN2368_c0_g1_i25:33-2129(+)